MSECIFIMLSAKKQQPKVSVAYNKTKMKNNKNSILELYVANVEIHNCKSHENGKIKNDYFYRLYFLNQN